jgi:hypothetical protein
MLNQEGKRYFITLPKECLAEGEKPTRLRLLRALYGLRASPKLWYKLFKSFLVENGWTEEPTEPCLFTKELPDGGGTCKLACHVDDSLAAAPTAEAADAIQDSILQKFEGGPIPAAEKTLVIGGK